MSYSPNSLIVFARPVSFDVLPHFPEKLVVEERVLAFDMSEAVPAGVVYQTASVTITCSNYADDPTPSSIQNGAVGLDVANGLVTVPVKAGVSGVSYVVKIECTTNSLFHAPVMIAVLPII